MTMIGETCMEDLVAYGPWFPREGDAATFFCDTIDVGGTTPTLDITIQHKNIEDTDTTPASPGSFTQISAAGTSNKRVTALKELVRFKYEIGGGGSSDAWVHFRMLEPAWETN